MGEDQVRLVTIQEATDPYGESSLAWLVRQPTDDLQATHALMTLDEIERLRAEVEELEKDIAFYRDGVSEDATDPGELRERIEELEKEADHLHGCEAELDAMLSTGIHITTDQIDAAVELANAVEKGQIVQFPSRQEDLAFIAGIWRGLGEFDIRRCEGCGGKGGSGGYSTYDFVAEETVGGFEPCPTCNGKGWVKEEK